MIVNAIKKYEEKTGEAFNYGKDFRLSLFVPPFKDEFMLYRVDIEDGIPYIWLDQMYGNMDNFVPFIRAVCEIGGITFIVTATTRSPKVHQKKWKMNHIVERDYVFEGRKYHFMLGELKNLK